MPEVKPENPPASATEIKKLEARLAKEREAFKTQTLAAINDLIVLLKDVGYEYELVEKAAGKPSGTHRCSNCGEIGHSKTTCPKAPKQ